MKPLRSFKRIPLIDKCMRVPLSNVKCTEPWIILPCKSSCPSEGPSIRKRCNLRRIQPWTEENVAFGTCSPFFIGGAMWVPAFSCKSARLCWEGRQHRWQQVLQICWVVIVSRRGCFSLTSSSQINPSLVMFWNQQPHPLPSMYMNGLS